MFLYFLKQRNGGHYETVLRARKVYWDGTVYTLGNRLTRGDQTSYIEHF